MSKKIFTDLDFQGAEVQNAVVHALASAPSSPTEGQIYYDSTTKTTYVWNGTAWQITPRKASDVPIEDTAEHYTATDVEAALAEAGERLDDVEAAIHTQNTDTGTTSSTFQLDSDDSGVKIKNAAGVLQARNAADTDYADMRVKNLTVEGTTTTINSETVELADNVILLNRDVAASSQNSDGGIAVKRLQSDDATRADAALNFNQSTGRWDQTFGDVASAQTAQTPVKRTFAIGNGTDRDFVCTHNLNTRDLVVSVRRNSSDYDIVEPSIDMTTVNAITVRFKGPVPAVNGYTVTVIG